MIICKWQGPPNDHLQEAGNNNNDKEEEKKKEEKEKKFLRTDERTDGWMDGRTDRHTLL